MKTSRRLVLASPLLVWAGGSPAVRQGNGYPKLMGMNIGAKNYDDPAYLDAMAKLDAVVLGFYPGWKGDRDGTVIRATVAQLKRRNPAIQIGQYTILNETAADRSRSADRDKIDKLDAEDWWLRRSDGSKTQWTRDYGAFDINITDWAPADRNGERYPQWLARRDARLWFERVPELEIWYFDNVMHRSRIAQANWRRDGRDVSSKDPEVQAAFRRAMAEHWEAARRAKPGLLLMGNADNDLSLPEYRKRLNAVFLEGLMGLKYSLETWGGWRKAMEHYQAAHSNLLPPAMVGFNVHGRPDDFAFFRYSFASCLLGDGYFCFTDDNVGFSSVPWFDEYDLRIGKPVDPTPKVPWMNGVYRRNYENAVVLVNPDTSARAVSVEKGWKRHAGKQVPDVNNGKPATDISLPSRDGLLLVRA